MSNIRLERRDRLRAELDEKGFDAVLNAVEEEIDLAADDAFEKGVNMEQIERYNLGYDDGYDAGRDEGRDEGYDDGYEAGYEAGRDAGFQAGVDSVTEDA